METTAYPDVPEGTIGVHSPRGQSVTLHYRADTSDLATIGSTFRLWGKLDDEYRLVDLHLGAGDVFVDIGAHIGSVVMAVLVDNPEATAIAVEPLPENIEVLAASAESAGVADRLTILQGAIAKGREATIAYDFDGDAYLKNHRYIGGMDNGLTSARARVTVPAVSIPQLVKLAGGTIAAMKLDCEGCEWQALRSTAVRNVRLIFGEWHGHSIGRSDGLAELRDILAKTHEVSAVTEQGGTGTFKAVPK